jgi:hypothetical protein
VRAVDVLDRALLLLGEREELPGGGVGAVDQLDRDAVADQGEEADLVGGAAQLVAEPRWSSGPPSSSERSSTGMPDMGGSFRKMPGGCADGGRPASTDTSARPPVARKGERRSRLVPVDAM